MKYTGKRIIELSEGIRRFLEVSHKILGFLYVIAAVICLLEQINGAEGAIIGTLVFGVMGFLHICFAGWIAEILTILFKGFGILVDRAERLKPEYLQEAECPREKNNVQPAKPVSAPAWPTKSQANLTKEDWICPWCGARNGGMLKECSICCESRPTK